MLDAWRDDWEPDMIAEYQRGTATP